MKTISKLALVLMAMLTIACNRSQNITMMTQINNDSLVAQLEMEQKRTEELYAEALRAMRQYSGHMENEYDE